MLPEHSRVWIYMADRLLNKEEIKTTMLKGMEFVVGWSSHGSAVRAACDVLEKCVLVLAVDENVEAPSGCSIDSSVRFMKSLGQELGVDWFNRLNVLYRTNDEVDLVSLDEFIKRFKASTHQDQFEIFNTLAASVAELNTVAWLPVKESWINRML